MRCPKCRMEIAFNALKHAACGWAVTSGGVNVAQVELAEVVAATLAQRLVHLERIRSIVGRERRSEAPPADRVRERVPMLKDVGHGCLCTCEVCWGERTRITRQRDVLGTKLSPSEEKLKPRARRLSVEELKKLFPVE